MILNCYACNGDRTIDLSLGYGHCDNCGEAVTPTVLADVYGVACYLTPIPQHDYSIDRGNGRYECAGCGMTIHIEVVPFNNEEVSNG